MTEIKHYEEIENYTTGNMSSSERKAFEERLTSDPALSEEYNAYMNAHKALKVLQAKYLKNKLAAPTQQQKTKIVPFRQRRISWAAAAAILILLSGMAWFANTQYNEQAIAAAFYRPPNLSGTKSADDARALEEASYAFNKNDFEKAIQLTASVPQENVNYGQAQYILGHAHLKTDNLPAAETAFRNVTALGKGADYHDAKWYLALVLIKEKKEKEAIKLLDEIISEGKGGYTKAAADLKGQLGSFWRNFVFG